MHKSSIGANRAINGSPAEARPVRRTTPAPRGRMGRVQKSMARVDPEAFADRELTRVFIAATLAEALQAENVLTERGVDYVVEVELLGRTLLGSDRYGAAFYVMFSQAPYCGSQLVAAGLAPGVLIDDETDS